MIGFTCTIWIIVLGGCNIVSGQYKQCGQPAGQSCNYVCKTEAEMELSCNGNDVIHLESGHYGFWICKGNDNCCTPPTDEDWMCIEMDKTEDEWLAAVGTCEGHAVCRVNVTFGHVAASNQCCRNILNRCDHHVTALIWSCVGVKTTAVPNSTWTAVTNSTWTDLTSDSINENVTTVSNMPTILPPVTPTTIDPTAVTPPVNFYAIGGACAAAFCSLIMVVSAFLFRRHRKKAANIVTPPPSSDELQATPPAADDDAGAAKYYEIADVVTLATELKTAVERRKIPNASSYYNTGDFSNTNPLYVNTEPNGTSHTGTYANITEAQANEGVVSDTNIHTNSTKGSPENVADTLRKQACRGMSYMNHMIPEDYVNIDAISNSIEPVREDAGTSMKQHTATKESECDDRPKSVDDHDYLELVAEADTSMRQHTATKESECDDRRKSVDDHDYLELVADDLHEVNQSDISSLNQPGTDAEYSYAYAHFPERKENMTMANIL